MPTLIPGAPVDAPIFARTPPVPDLEAELHLVPRAYWPRVTPLLGRTASACYLLIDSLTEDRRIRVGETQDVAQRLTRHRADGAMRWADMAVIVCGAPVDKDMALALQQALEIYMRDRAAVTLMALAPAPTPRIGEEQWRRVNRLALNILSTLPRLDVILNPEPPRDHFEGARVVERIFDLADIEETYAFAARGIQAAAAMIAGDYYILAGSEIRVLPAECALPKHRETRLDLAARGRLFESFAPGRVRIGNAVRVPSLDAGGKFVVGDRHRYGAAWLECEPGNLPEACLDRLAGDAVAGPRGGRA